MSAGDHASGVASPTELPFGQAWIAEYFAEVDRMNIAGLVAWYAEDATFRFANVPTARGKVAISAALGQFYGLIASMSHRMTGCWIEGTSGVWEAEVTFGTGAAETITIPAVSILRTDGRLVRDFRMVMDAGPILASASEARL